MGNGSRLTAVRRPHLEYAGDTLRTSMCGTEISQVLDNVGMGIPDPGCHRHHENRVLWAMDIKTFSKS